MDFFFGLVCTTFFSLANARTATTLTPTAYPLYPEFDNCGFNLNATCDDKMKLFADGKLLATSEDWKKTSVVYIPPNTGEIEIRCIDGWILGGILAASENGLITNNAWNCSSDNGTTWNNAHELGANGVTAEDISPDAKWIWTDRPTWTHTKQKRHTTAICTIQLPNKCGTTPTPTPSTTTSCTECVPCLFSGTTPTPTLTPTTTTIPTPTTPKPTPGFNLNATCNNKMELFVDRNLLATSYNWRDTSQVHIPARTQTIEIHCSDSCWLIEGILASSDNGLITDNSWNCSSDNGITWSSAHEIVPNGLSVPDISPDAKWISTGQNTWMDGGKVICKVMLDVSAATTSTTKEPELNGYCLTSGGHDQNSGTQTLKTGDKDSCYHQCKAVPQATGCEWHKKGFCIYHTLDVATGNGNSDYKCWVFNSGIQPESTTPMPTGCLYIDKYVECPEFKNQCKTGNFVDCMNRDCAKTCKCGPQCEDCSPWSSWSTCSSTCGIAAKTRTRTCPKLPCRPRITEETASCHLPSCGPYIQQKCFLEDSNITFLDLGHYHMNQDLQPVWKIADTGRSLTETLNTRPSIGLSNLGDVTEPVSFSGRVFSASGDDDVIGIVFGFWNEANFFVIASARQHPGPTNWYVARLHATCGSSCATTTTISDAIWDPQSHPDDITVLATGSTYWQHGNEYNFTVSFNPSDLLLSASVTNENQVEPILESGIISAKTNDSGVDAVSRKGGFVGVYVDSQAHTTWDYLVCQDSHFIAPTPVKSCSVGEEYDGNCYIKVETPMTWLDAEDDCNKRNGTLASIDNAEANNFVATLAGEHTAWIGASDTETEGSWKWTNGDNVLFTNWYNGQPDNWSGKQHCAAINYLQFGKWDDDQCGIGSLHPFICQGRFLSKVNSGPVLIHTDTDFKYYKVPVPDSSNMTSATVLSTCSAHGMKPQCFDGREGYRYNDNNCVRVDECSTHCAYTLSNILCSTKNPRNCKSTMNMFWYMDNWASGSACGVTTRGFCSTGKDYTSTSDIQYFAACIKTNQDSIYFIAGGAGTLRDIELYHPTMANLSCSMSPPPLKNFWYVHTTFYYNNTIHLYGGNSGTASICISYNINMEEWKRHTLTTSRNYGHSSTILNKRVYIIGGRNTSNNYVGAESTPLPLRDQPVLTPVLNLDYKGMYQCTTKVDEDTLVVTGGYYNDYLSSVIEYNAKTRTTTSLPSLKKTRYTHGCVMVEMDNTKWIIVAGGYNPTDKYLQTTEMLQIGGSFWRALGNLNVARYGHSIAVTQRGVMTMGGYDGSGSLNSVELLDWSAKSWRIVQPSLSKSRAYFGGAVEIPASMFDCRGQQQQQRNFPAKQQYHFPKRSELEGSRIPSVPEQLEQEQEVVKIPSLSKIPNEGTPKEVSLPIQPEQGDLGILNLPGQQNQEAPNLQSFTEQSDPFFIHTDSNFKYYKVPVPDSSNMTSATVLDACTAHGMKPQCVNGKEGYNFNDNNCVRVEECKNYTLGYCPFVLSDILCSTNDPKNCTTTLNMFYYMNNWYSGSACGVTTRHFCSIGKDYTSTSDTQYFAACIKTNQGQQQRQQNFPGKREQHFPKLLELEGSNIPGLLKKLEQESSHIPSSQKLPILNLPEQLEQEAPKIPSLQKQPNEGTPKEASLLVQPEQGDLGILSQPGQHNEEAPKLQSLTEQSGMKLEFQLKGKTGMEKVKISVDGTEEEIGLTTEWRLFSYPRPSTGSFSVEFLNDIGYTDVFIRGHESQVTDLLPNFPANKFLGCGTKNEDEKCGSLREGTLMWNGKYTYNLKDGSDVPPK